MRHARLIAAIGFAAIGVAALLGACAADEGESAATIDVTLQEWAVVVSDDSAPAGEVTFSITNDGPEDVHEFVVFMTDLDVEALPTDDTGAVDEEAEGIAVIGEVEDVAVGDSAELTVTLEPGSYALVCNIYSEDEDEAHYQMGMRTAFTATE